MLRPLTTLYGAAELLDGEPALEIAHDILHIPEGVPGHRPGLYRPDGTLLPIAAYRRGVPTTHLPVEAPTTTLRHADIPCAAEDAPTRYAGHLTGHYGHFLFSCLSRLWDPTGPGERLLVIRANPVEHVFRRPFVAAIFAALGIAPAQVVRLAAPVRLRRIVVPAAAAEENLSAHRDFGRFCRALGDAALRTGDPAPALTRPVFLSKARLETGESAIVNEAALCRALEALGVEIAWPERLPFAAQVQLCRTVPLLLGIAGSAFHTLAFAAARNAVALAPDPLVNSNQALIDGIAGSRTVTLYPEGLVEPVAAPPGFKRGWRLRRPHAIARALLAQAEALGPVSRA